MSRVFLLALAIGLSSFCAARSLPASLRPGADIFVVWDCLPQWTGEVVGQMVGAQLGPCYGERLKIRADLRHGWAEVIDVSDGSVWTVNLSRAIAVQRVIQQVPAD